MSTRSQVEFRVIYRGRHEPVFPETVGKEWERIERRTIYRHSDGYPSGILPDLIGFIRWNNGRMDDAEYTAANWIFYNKREDEERYTEYAKKGQLSYKKGSKFNWRDQGSDGNGHLKLGFGVCNNDELHGDIEYYYRITCERGKEVEPSITIECYRPYDMISLRRDKMDVIISDLAKAKPTSEPPSVYAIFRDYKIDMIESEEQKVDFDKPFAKIVLGGKGKIEDVVGFWFDKKKQEIRYEEVDD